MQGGERETPTERWFEEPMDWVGGYDYPPPESSPPAEPRPPAPPPETPEAPALRRLAPGDELVIAGHFAPLHRGHTALLEQAARTRRRVTVLVAEDGAWPVPGATRARWVEQLGLGVEVQVVEGDRPFDAADEGSARGWGPRLAARVPGRPVALVSADAGDEALGRAMRARFALLDRERARAPATSAEVRAAPGRHWDQIAASARADLALRVCLFGPEGTGKSTLAARLAGHYATRWVPEALRSVMVGAGLALRPDHVDAAARKFLLDLASMGAAGGRVILLDTDLLALSLWSERALGGRSVWLAEQTARLRVDHYLLTDLVEGQGASPAPGVSREVFFLRCQGALAGKPHTRLSGTLDDRFELARGIIDDLMTRPLW